MVGDDVSTYVVPGERYQATPTKDGQLIYWTGTAEQMRGGLRAMGRNDLAESERHRGVRSGEEASAIERAEVMANGIARMTTVEAYEALLAEEVPVAPVLQHKDVLEDPQLVHNGAIIEAHHPVYGTYRRARAAARFSGTSTTPSASPAATRPTMRFSGAPAAWASPRWSRPPTPPPMPSSPPKNPLTAPIATQEEKNKK